ncbi:MAG: protein phosphatase 2C domain-containing protein, partial [Chloroflexota bacterium]
MGMWFRQLFGQSGDEPEDNDISVRTTKQEAGSSSSVSTVEADTTTPSNIDTSNGVEEREEDTLPVRPQNLPADGATRQLPLETVIASRNAHLQFGYSTDVGMVRTNNQDSMLSMYYAGRSVENRPDFGLFIVADGMGGHHDGEKASAIVTRIVAKHVLNNIFMPMMSEGDDNFEQTPLTESLTEAIQTANADVLSEVPDGGTTVTAVAVVV